MKVGKDIFLATDLFSQKMPAGVYSGTPNICNSYPKDDIIYIKIFKAMNSYPNTEVLNILLCFLNKKIGAFLVYINIPVCDLEKEDICVRPTCGSGLSR